MSNEVTLELTGDQSSLERAIESATRQVQSMDTTVATAATSIDNSSGKLERMADRSDRLATSSGTLAGGIGSLTDGMELLGVESDSVASQAVAGLALAIGTLSGIMDIAAVSSASSTVAMIGQKVATVAGTVATGAATVAQWALNTAMAVGLGPILLIVAGVALLVAIIVLIATKTTWFQDGWKAAWNGIKVAAGAVKDFFVETVWERGIKRAFDNIVSGVTTVKDWFASIPGKLSSSFSGLFNIITSPFRAAFNFVSDIWNNTIGQLSWTVPNWVPGIGGNTISVQKLPKFHMGGVIGGGPEGAEVAIVARVGERVQTREMQAAESGGSVTYNITVQGNKFRDGTDFEDWLDDLRNDGRGGGEVDE